MMDVDAILKKLVENHGSDVHFKVGRPPLFRLLGELLPSEFPVVSAEDMEALAKKLLGEHGFERLQHEWECDSAYAIEGVGRFRINAFRQQGKIGLVLRAIPPQPPTIDQMGLPPVLKDIVMAPQGMILVTGPTGSGKSTTLAAMIEHLNRTQPLHIVTIEDPIEFVYTDNKCTINQRQLGSDVRTLHEALRRALRQDPDCILLGEMRDRETIELAMHAAETGHIVFSTLHTNDAKQTIDRIIDIFPPDARNQVLSVLALTLHAVISQRLIRRADGNGRVCAMEIMINSPGIRELIAQGRTRELDKAIQSAGSFYRMQTFNQSLADLVKRNLITEEEALANSSAPGDLKLMIRGVTTGTTQIPAAAPAPNMAPGSNPEEKGKLQIKRGF